MKQHIKALSLSEHTHANTSRSKIQDLSWTIAISSALFSSIALGESRDVRKPGQVQQEVLKHYKSLKTFSCNGHVSWTVEREKETHPHKTTFSILLDRSGHFKITWDNAEGSPGTQSLKARVASVWSSTKGSFLDLGDGKPPMSFQNATIALGAAAVPSHGISYEIPILFYHTEMRIGIGVLSRLKSLGTEVLAGKTYFKIEGESPVSERETYWISQGQYLIHKISIIRNYKAPSSLSQPAEGPEISRNILATEIAAGLPADIPSEVRKELDDWTREAPNGTTVKIHSEVEFTDVRINVDTAPADFEFKSAIK